MVNNDKVNQSLYRVTLASNCHKVVRTMYNSNNIARAPAFVKIGKVETGDTAAVVNSGTERDVILEFTLPRGPTGSEGPPGKSATVTVGTVTLGREMTVTNKGNDTDAVLDFTLVEGVPLSSSNW